MRESKQPVKISAILPIYNAMEFLPNALASLLNQKDPFEEIIIVDDGSEDESLHFVNQMMAIHTNILLICHEKNKGVCAALNTGIKKATGDYILLCAADDFYHANIVTLAKDALLKFPNVGLICGDAIVSRFDKEADFYRMLPYAKNTFIHPRDFKLMSRKTYVGFNGGGGMFINRNAILKAGGLIPEMRWHCDWLLYFAIAFTEGIYYIDQAFVTINMRKEGYSEGKQVWKIQKQVIIDTIHILDRRYPELWNDFKSAALLPHYSLRYIYLFFFTQPLRRFCTAKLLWKLIVNNEMVVRFGRLFPYRTILRMRKLLKA